MSNGPPPGGGWDNDQGPLETIVDLIGRFILLVVILAIIIVPPTLFLMCMGMLVSPVYP